VPLLAGLIEFSSFRQQLISVSAQRLQVDKSTTDRPPASISRRILEISRLIRCAHKYTTARASYRDSPVRWTVVVKGLAEELLKGRDFRTFEGIEFS